MPALCRRQNFRNIVLHADTTGETVGVFMSNGRSRQVRWLGFLALEEAKRLERVKAVKLDVARYSDSGIDWIDLRPGEFVQGCLTAEGVYAVTAPRVRIVNGKK